ncbi:DUF3124 domain-containing protein [Crocosphaera sp. UHCC 0190]|uniref:DUF3124 domain-containing protein n=1 Tax=Crocosphaera sp. UHCC 0190 TaxID=3110246 RepID=UPI002B204AB3|nr:DUF3124 domain-containing protein [Crocosphaera sp. UHCC 0190]MEA5509554.1 DUF3124 domain-containing protein [Crocosphaera sp. UHCC 0190]
MKKKVLTFEKQWHFLVNWAIAIIILTSCSPQPLSPRPQAPTNPTAQLKAVTVDKIKIIQGQTIYVPIYSHIYHINRQDNVINLAATLSIRNTDRLNPIIIKAISYYDTNGQLIKQYLENPVELKSLASTEVFIAGNDVTGGSGANFIVEWVAQNRVSEPIIEAVMISTASAQGISFISPGRVLKQYVQEK